MRHRLLSVGLLLVIGTAAAFALVGATLNTTHWGELMLPALVAAALLTWGLGTLVFTPTRRRRP